LIPRYHTVLDIVEHAFENYKDLPAFTCLDHCISFAELDALSERFARYLRHDLALQPGDRLALQLPNILQFPVAFFGALRAGIVIVNINPLYTAREIKHQLCDSGAKALVVLANVADKAASIIDQTPVEKVIVTGVADLHPTFKRLLIHGVLKYIKKSIPVFGFKNSVTMREVLARELPGFPRPEVTAETLMVLQYTGGTTGISKGAMLSHGNLASNVWQMVSHLPQAFDEGRETFAACLPLYHIYALNLHALCGFSRGGHNILVPNPRDMAATTKALLKHQVTVFVGISTLFNALYRFAPFAKVDFSKLKVSSAGGMALSDDAAEAWLKLTGCEVCEGYGLTETSPVVAGNLYDDICRGTVGYPLPETEVKLVNDDNEMVEGEAGELCVRGPQVMQGYWNMEAETRDVLSEDGWLKTGDIAEFDEQGRIRIVDRKKDLILVSGFNVYPNEVEETVTQMPGILEAAAVGMPHEKCGEVVKLHVVVEDGAITKDDVMAYCRSNLTPYKVPKVIEFHDSLPKSNVGKILRKELKP